MLHENPDENVKLHCDKHVVKMILEYAQMLSTAHRVLDGDEKQSVPVTKTNKVAVVGRNELCPCGSGKKYKRCHGSNN